MNLSTSLVIHYRHYNISQLGSYPASIYHALPTVSRWPCLVCAQSVAIIHDNCHSSISVDRVWKHILTGSGENSYFKQPSVTAISVMQCDQFSPESSQRVGWWVGESVSERASQSNSVCFGERVSHLANEWICQSLSHSAITIKCLIKHFCIWKCSVNNDDALCYWLLWLLLGDIFPRLASESELIRRLYL